MENFIATYSMFSMVIVFALTTLFSIIPFKSVRRLSKPIAYVLIIFAPIVLAILVSIVCYKVCKWIFTHRYLFLSRKQKLKIIEKMYNSKYVNV